MGADCMHGISSPYCVICNPPARRPTPKGLDFTESEQDAIARFVRAHARDMLDPGQRNDWLRSNAFLYLCAGIPDHSEESVKLQVKSMSSMLGLGPGMHVQAWMSMAWDRTA